MNNHSNYKVEMYLVGELCAADELAFEVEMLENPELAQRVREQASVTFDKTFEEMFKDFIK